MFPQLCKANYHGGLKDEAGCGRMLMIKYSVDLHTKGAKSGVHVCGECRQGTDDSTLTAALMPHVRVAYEEANKTAPPPSMIVYVRNEGEVCE